jgi:hypothetical protein
MSDMEGKSGPLGVEDDEIVGGLGVDTYSPEIAGNGEFNPMSLLEVDKVPVDVLRENKDVIYTELHRLQSLPDDNPHKMRYEKIRSVIETTKEDWERENPDTNMVVFKKDE